MPPHDPSATTAARPGTAEPDEAAGADSARLRAAALQELQRQGLRLEFDATLRGRYRDARNAERVEEQRRIALIGAATYLVLLLGLVLLAPDSRPLRILLPQILLPVLATAFLRQTFARREVDFTLREIATLCASLTYSGVTLWAISTSGDDLLLVRLCFAMLPMLVALFFLNLPFALSVIGVALNAIGMLAVTLVHRQALGVFAPYPLMLMLSATLPGLYATHRLERAQRRVFLHQLLQTLRIADLAAENERLAAMAASDPVTFCANRRQLELALAGIPPGPAGSDLLLLIDLDHFRQLNDLHGHLAGDECLRAAAGAIAQTLQGSALLAGGAPAPLLARFGGDEFAVLLREVKPRDGEDIARQIAHALATLNLDHIAPNLRLGASMGLALRGRDDDGMRLLMMADAALYNAKNTGRNCLRWPPLAA